MAQATRVGYRVNLQEPKDHDIKDRNRGFRYIVALLTVAAVIGIGVGFPLYWGYTLGWQKTGIFFGLIAATILSQWIIPKRLLVYNPEYTAYVTQDAFKGELVPYGPGLHLSLPWEQRNASGNFSLQVITREFTVSIPTKTAKLDAKCKYEWTIDLEGIRKAIGIDETTIDEGITAFFESFLTSRCADKDAEWARKNINDLNAQLAAQFMDEEMTDPDAPVATPVDEKPMLTPKDFGKRYGFKTVGLVIAGFTFPKAVQEARDAIDESANVQKAIAATLGIEPTELAERLRKGLHGEPGGISAEMYKELLHNAMATSGNATMDISVMEGSLGNALGKALERMVSGNRGDSSGRTRRTRGQSRPNQPRS